MKLLAIAALALGLVTLQASAQQKGKETASTKNGITLKTSTDSVSYMIGLDIGQSLKQKSLEISIDPLARGISDVMMGSQPILTEAQIREVMMGFQKRIEARMNEVGAKNKQAGEEFLAKNAKKPGVTVLPSGLQYEVITAGTGATPKATDQVTTHYRGTLLDGTTFDSSYDRGEPATFPVNGVIPGWTEALQLMKVGSKWRLYIPSNLAYGEQGAGQGKIGPNAMLIFDIELLAIK